MRLVPWSGILLLPLLAAWLLLGLDQATITFLHNQPWQACLPNGDCKPYKIGIDLSRFREFQGPAKQAILITKIPATLPGASLLLHDFGPTAAVYIDGREVYRTSPANSTLAPFFYSLPSPRQREIELKVILENTTGTQLGIFGAFTGFGNAGALIALLFASITFSIWQPILAVLILVITTMALLQRVPGAGRHLAASTLVIPVALHLTGAFRGADTHPLAYPLVWSCVIALKFYFILTVTGLDQNNKIQWKLASLFFIFSITALFTPYFFGTRSYSELRIGFIFSGWGPIISGALLLYAIRNNNITFKQFFSLTLYLALSIYDQLVFAKWIPGPYFIHLEYVILALQIAKESADSAARYARKQVTIQRIFREIGNIDGLTRAVNLISELFTCSSTSLLAIEGSQEYSVLLAKTDEHPYLATAPVGAPRNLRDSPYVHRAVKSLRPSVGYTMNDGGYIVFPLIKGREAVAVICLRGFKTRSDLQYAEEELDNLSASFILHLEKNYWLSRAEEQAAARLLLAQLVHPAEEKTKITFVRNVKDRIGNKFGILYLDLVNFTTQTGFHGESEAELALTDILNGIASFCCNENCFFTYRGGDTIIIFIPQLSLSSEFIRPAEYFALRTELFERTLSDIRSVLRQHKRKFFFDVKGSFLEGELPAKFNETWNPAFLVSQSINLADRLSRESCPGFIAWQANEIPQGTYGRKRVLLKRRVTLPGFSKPTDIALMELQGFSLYSDLGAIG